jgi:hypothetical protein
MLEPTISFFKMPIGLARLGPLELGMWIFNLSEALCNSP